MPLSSEEQQELDELIAQAPNARGHAGTTRMEMLEAWKDKPPCEHLEVWDYADLPDKIEGDFTYGDSPEDIAQDNMRRASFASVAVKAFAQATMPGGGEEPSTAIGDLLADLRHLCDVLALDFDALSCRGSNHYGEETMGKR